MKRKKMIQRICSTAMGICMMATAWSFAGAEVTVCPEESPLITISAETEVSQESKTAMKDTKPKMEVKSSRYDRLKLIWEPVSGASGYQIYRATSKTGKYSKVATVKGESTASYTNTGLTCGKTYYYKVRAYGKTSEKTTYSKFSTVMSGKPVPSRTKVKDAWGSAGTILGTWVEWQGIAGATDYEVQTRYTLNGKTTSWNRKVKTIDDEWLPFKTYNTLYREAKKEYPSGYVTGVVLAGYPQGSKIPLKGYVESTAKKNQAWISGLPQDGRTYEFRVRAYRTVSGKKVYGAWSNPYTMVETLDIDAAYAELESYAKDYAAKNYPAWKYIDDHEGMNDSNASYYIEGKFGGSSRYARQDDFIKNYKKDIARYIDRMKSSGGQQEGFVYIKRVRPGDSEGLGINDSGETYYKVWMLY